MGPSALPSIDREGAVRWLVDLCRHDTTTGSEDRGLPALVELLESLEATIVRQAVQPGRTNVLATWGAPRVLFATHTDTVPPFVAPTTTDSAVRGRGACDAKGQIVAQLAAIGALLATGVRDVAWLGVVGEETDSVGATAAEGLRASLADCIAVVVGEPTECRLATGQRGIDHYRLTTRGRAAHSATGGGHNAILDLLDWIAALRDLPAARDPELGAESWNLGTIGGGIRANVVPDEASAEILARTVPGSELGECLRRLAPEGATVDLLQRSPSARFPAVAAFARAPVPFGSDAPRLRALASTGTVVLAGPGRIDVAHGTDEEITFDELEAGIRMNVELAAHLLGGGA